MHDQQVQHALTRKLRSIFDLSPAEEHAISTLPFHVREFQAHHDIAREHDRPSQSCVSCRG
jgi:hypothetical protein